MTQLNQPAHPTTRRAPAFARSRQRAFTIVEVLVAMGILAIGISSVFTLLPVAAIIQKQAVDAAQGPEFGNSVLALLKQTMSRTDPCFGADPSTLIPRFRALETAIETQRYSFNNNLTQLYNYQMVYRRLTANGPVEVAILVYRRLPEEGQNTSASALKTDVSISSSPTNVYGSSGPTSPTDDRGLMKTVAISTDQAITGNLFLVGNADTAYFTVKYVGTGTATAPGYGYRVSPIPVNTCEDVVSLKKNPVTAIGSLTCVAIVTGVIQ